MEDYSDYCDKETEKLLAKQAKCEHKKEVIICCKCKECGKWWTKDLTLKIEGITYKYEPKTTTI